MYFKIHSCGFYCRSTGILQQNQQQYVSLGFIVDFVFHWERSATFSQHKLTCSGCKICTAVHFSCRLCVILTNLIHSAGTVYSPCEHTLPVLVLTLLLWETVVSVPIILLLWGSPVIGPRHFHFIVTVLERWPAQIYILLPCSVHSVFLG